MCVSFRNSTDFFEAVQPRVAIFRITGFWLLAQFFGRLTYFNFSTRIFVFKTLASTGYCHSSNNHLQPLLGTETMDSDSGHHSWHGSQDHTERLEPLQPPSPLPLPGTNHHHHANETYFFRGSGQKILHADHSLRNFVCIFSSRTVNIMKTFSFFASFLFAVS